MQTAIEVGGRGFRQPLSHYVLIPGVCLHQASFICVGNVSISISPDLSDTWSAMASHLNGPALVKPSSLSM